MVCSGVLPSTTAFFPCVEMFPQPSTGGTISDQATSLFSSLSPHQVLLRMKERAIPKSSASRLFSQTPLSGVPLVLDRIFVKADAQTR